MSVGSVLHDIGALFPKRGHALPADAQEVLLKAAFTGTYDQTDAARLAALGGDFVPGGGANNATQVIKSLPKDGSAEVLKNIQDAVRNAGSTLALKFKNAMTNWKQSNFPKMLDNVYQQQLEAMQAANQVAVAKTGQISRLETGLKHIDETIKSFEGQLARATDPVTKAGLETSIATAKQQRAAANEALVAATEAKKAFELEYQTMQRNLQMTQDNIGILKAQWEASKASGKLTTEADQASKSLIKIEDDVAIMNQRAREADAAALAKLRELNSHGPLPIDPTRPAG